MKSNLESKNIEEEEELLQTKVRNIISQPEEIYERKYNIAQDNNIIDSNEEFDLIYRNISDSDSNNDIMHIQQENVN